MNYSNRTLVAVIFVMVTMPLFAQKVRCQDALTRAHRNLADLYGKSNDSTGYSLRVAIDATMRVATQQSPEQKFRMSATKRELLIESESFDSYQDDSIKVTVFKKENKIYITPASQRDAITEYMENFQAIQGKLVSLVSVVGCSIVKNSATIDAVTKKDTLGLATIKNLKYSIDLAKFQITALDILFVESEPVQSYAIHYSDVIQGFNIPSATRKHYHTIATNARNGELKFDTYSLIDTRKRNTR